MLIVPLFFIGLVCGVFSFIMSFIITYEEYQKHHFVGKQLYREAFSVAIAAFLIFVGLSLLAGFILDLMLF